MTEQPPENAIARIDRALARIEAAAARAADAQDRLARHNVALRAEIGAAIAALDSLIADEEDAG